MTEIQAIEGGQKDVSSLKKNRKKNIFVMTLLLVSFFQSIREWSVKNRKRSPFWSLFTNQLHKQTSNTHLQELIKTAISPCEKN